MLSGKRMNSSRLSIHQEKDATQAPYEVVGHPTGRATLEHQAEPDQRQQGRAAFAKDIQPDPLTQRFELTVSQVEHQPEVGRQQKQGEFEAVRAQHGEHGRNPLPEAECGSAQQMDVTVR